MYYNFKIIRGQVKESLEKYFQSFFYFFGYLRYRMVLIFGLSLAVGVLDGFGLAMFIPLLEMFGSDEGNSGADAEAGKLEFLPVLFSNVGIPFNEITVLFLILLFFSLKGLAKFIQSYVNVINMQFFMRKIRVTNIHLMDSFSYSSFVTSDSGRIQNTFSGEVEKLNTAFIAYMAAMQHVTLVLVYLILALSSNFGFALMAGIGGVGSNLIFRNWYKRSKKLSKEITSENHGFQGLLIQHVASFKYLKATGLNRKFSSKLISSIKGIERIQRRIGFISSLILGFREPLTILVVVSAIVVEILYFNAEMGSIILSLLLLYRALTFLMAMQSEWNRFIGVSGSLDNMKAFVKELIAGKEMNGKISINSFSSAITLKNLSFSYGSNKILDGINLEIRRDESVALVGPSGSGKTTLLNIMCGLIKPQQGQIFIDDQSYSGLDIYSLKEKIGYISQESPTFNDSVFNNVTFWDEKDSTSLGKFYEAIKRASLLDYMKNLPNKEDEYIGNNGINLSGGQKQRLAIARELYKDVDLLFMDEATSALDGETEAAIQSNIEALQGNYTLVMIAHRLSTIKNVDKIVILVNGKIEDQGSFSELMERSNTFKKMAGIQGL